MGVHEGTAEVSHENVKLKYVNVALKKLKNSDKA